MGILNRKKKSEIETQIDTNYIKWEDDLGFLIHIMKRKTEIVIKFNIGIFKEQLQDGVKLRDEDIQPYIQSITEETLKLISNRYREFLITKYFNNQIELIKYVSEYVYVELTTSAINANIGITNKNIQKTKLEILDGLNQK